MAKADKSGNLLFPAAGCNPKLDFLDRLKTCAERAKLEQGQLLVARVPCDVRDAMLVGGGRSAEVKEWPGHEDMESTMRYLSRRAVSRFGKRLTRSLRTGNRHKLCEHPIAAFGD